MSRRLATTGLVFALLLTQWVGAFRCDGRHAPGRESRPHVHLDGWLPTVADEADCHCHRHGAKPEHPPDVRSGWSAARTIPTDRDDPPTDAVLVLPTGADWGPGSAAAPGTGSAAPDEATFANVPAALRAATPIPPRITAGTPPFPVELATRSLRI